MIRSAYCLCGVEIQPYEIEAITLNVIWQSCGSKNCRYRAQHLKTDDCGFVIEPTGIRGRYLYKNPILEDKNA